MNSFTLTAEDWFQGENRVFIYTCQYVLIFFPLRPSTPHGCTSIRAPLSHTADPSVTLTLIYDSFLHYPLPATRSQRCVTKDGSDHRSHIPSPPLPHTLKSHLRGYWRGPVACGECVGSLGGVWKSHSGVIDPFFCNGSITCDQY